MTEPTCRACGKAIPDVLVDLGMSPLANSYVPADRPDAPETFFPLRVLVCGQCFLVQTPPVTPPSTIFEHYAYFSSWSSSWVDHARSFAAWAVDELGLDRDSFAVEIASNDGYLLRWLVEAGVPVLGVEPAANVAAEATARGVPTRVAFFGADLGAELAADRRADLVVANNVLAHVPDLHDFVRGVALLLAEDGLSSFEFPHLLRLMADTQYDTIYHEHLSYFSLHSLLPVFADHGMSIVDVVELPTHGGSLRLLARLGDQEQSPRVGRVLDAERAAGVTSIDAYRRFAPEVERSKRRLLRTLFDLRDAGARIAGYGAPAKANTLLNYCGIGTDVVEFTVDANPAKQGTLLPGSRIPVLHPDALTDARPDVVWLLPWNIRDELVASLEAVRSWGGRFLVAQPTVDLW